MNQTILVENKQKLSFVQKWTKNCFYPNLDEKKLFFVQVQSPKSDKRKLSFVQIWTKGSACAQ